MASGRNRNARRARKNRKLGPPIWRRLPPPRALGQLLLRAARASVPALVALVSAAVVGGGGLYGYRWLTGSDDFAVTRLEVRGGGAHSDEARVRTLLGVGQGDNIFRVSTAALEERLVADPWIAGARVSRRLPDTLIAEVSEEHAAAVVELGGLYLADSAGRVFKRVNVAAGEGLGLPIVTGITRKAYVRSPESAAAKVREALEALAVYRTVDGRPTVSEVHLDARQGVVFYTYDGAMAIRVGSGDDADIARRLVTFDAAWGALSQEERAAARVVYVDNQARPDRVTVGFAEPRRSDG